MMIAQYGDQSCLPRPFTLAQVDLGLSFNARCREHEAELSRLCAR